MYIISTCVWCKRTKIFLKDNNIEYEYVDVDLSSRENRETIRKEILKRGGKLTYPAIIIDDKVLINGFRKDEIKERVQKAAGALGIGELLDRKPKQLSGGQRQRVALGRAIVREPAVFLMDEPLSQMDARLRVEMRATLRRLQQDLGITTIYVTHDQLEAQSVADKIVVMRLGRIQQVGSPVEIYSNPASLFVAGFIGSPPMNFLDCHLEQREGQVYVQNDHFAFPLKPDLAEYLSALRPQMKKAWLSVISLPIEIVI